MRASRIHVVLTFRVITLCRTVAIVTYYVKLVFLGAVRSRCSAGFPKSYQRAPKIYYEFFTENINQACVSDTLDSQIRIVNFGEKYKHFGTLTVSVWTILVAGTGPYVNCAPKIKRQRISTDSSATHEQTFFFYYFRCKINCVTRMPRGENFNSIRSNQMEKKT